MTTIEAASRLARRLKTGDFTKLSMSELADVLEAMNSGIQRTYAGLPERFRRTTVSIELEAPRTVSVNVTEGSADLGGSSFNGSDVGKSVVIAGDANWNEVTAVNALMDSYLGATNAAASAIVYFDSILDSSYPFERLVGHPMLADERRTLEPLNAREAGWSPSIGEPRYYWLEDMAAAIGGEPRFVMRLYPAPDRAYNLRLKLAFLPNRLLMTDLITPATLAVPEEVYETCFLPLCLEHLAVNSPAWADPAAKPEVIRHAGLARQYLTMQAGQAGVPMNRVQTPAGY